MVHPIYDVDVCVTVLQDSPPELPLREELHSLGAETVYKPNGREASSRAVKHVYAQKIEKQRQESPKQGKKSNHTGQQKYSRLQLENEGDDNLQLVEYAAACSINRDLKIEKKHEKYRKSNLLWKSKLDEAKAELQRTKAQLEEIVSITISESKTKDANDIFRKVELAKAQVELERKNAAIRKIGHFQGVETEIENAKSLDTKEIDISYTEENHHVDQVPTQPKSQVEREIHDAKYSVKERKWADYKTKVERARMEVEQRRILSPPDKWKRAIEKNETIRINWDDEIKARREKGFQHHSKWIDEAMKQRDLFLRNPSVATLRDEINLADSRYI